MIKPEKNVPIPRRKGKGRTAVYPFATMGIGDSFVFPTAVSGSARQMACAAGKRLTRRFETRQTAKGVRCWRVE